MSDLLKEKPLRMTAGAVREALKRYYPHPAYGIVFEVAKSTGFAANRHLDAIAMSLWPSRGLHICGIEIKVSYADWQRERANPQKAEEMARLCDYFYIAAPRGIVPVSEVPPNWGLIEIREKKTVEAKAPAKLEPTPLTREFVAAVFRAASRGPDPEMAEAAIAERRKELDEKFEQRVDAEVQHRTARDNHDAAAWRKLTEALGHNPKSWHYLDEDGVIAAVRAVEKAGIAGAWHGIKNLHDTLETALARTREVMAEFAARPAEAKTEP